MLLLLFSVLVFVYSVHSQFHFDCSESYCSTPGRECPEFSCEDGRTVKNATKCGCCPLCIKSLKEGDECSLSYRGLTKEIAECGAGLICKETPGRKRKCVATECLERKRSYEKAYSSYDKPLLEPTFKCDHFGKFEATDDDSSKPFIVCIKDVLCFCVDKNGKRIFGTDFATNNVSKSRMDCNCSRDISDISEFSRKVDAKYLPRCLSNGDYDPLQCVQNKCFCMDFTHHHDDEAVNSTNMNELPCYNEERHKDNRKTKCLTAREEEIKRFKNRNLTTIGVDLTQCELDGTYSPLQCKEGRCYCVSRDGEKYPDYVGKDDGRLLCRCLRDKEIIQNYKNKKTTNMEIFEEIRCDKNYISDEDAILRSFVSDFMK